MVYLDCMTEGDNYIYLGTRWDYFEVTADLGTSREELFLKILYYLLSLIYCD